jgi:hypothetical protein
VAASWSRRSRCSRSTSSASASAWRARLLKQEPDFTTDERFEYDRKKVPWAASGELDELWRKSVKNDWLRLKLAGKKPDDIRKTLDKLRHAGEVGQ